MTRPLVAIIAAMTLLAAAACCCCGNSIDWEQILEPTISFGPFDPLEPLAPGPTTPPEPTPVLTRAPVSDAADETERLLETTDVPVRDLHDLAIRLRGVAPETPRTINPQGSPDYAVGTSRIFWASDVDTDQQFEVTARLEYKTEHVYMWVEEGASFDRNALRAAADLFEEETYSTNRSFFGSEWSPGVDNDPHVSILHARGLGDTIAGYYSSADEFVQVVRDDSNQMEMFYINIDNVTINDDFYNGVLAHEFQHMIHWYNDRNEETWINEGFSELAMSLNEYDTGGSDWAFAIQPDTQLNTWPEGPGAASANYGAGYLFTTYFLDRFGSDATQALVAHPENSFRAVDRVLLDLGAGMDHVDLFADWVVSNLLDDPRVNDGLYAYSTIDPPSPDIVASYHASDYPLAESATVHQYATDYIELYGQEPLAVSFSGSTQIGLLDASAHSGSYLWWSNRGDDSDMTLTRQFDLSDVQAATLEFWTWYDLEEDWDYAYLEISQDMGETWQILETPSGTDSNPNGNSFGWAYTGVSGSGRAPVWIQERVDLAPYCGQEVVLRFEMITDDAVNRPGFAIDDLAISAIGYATDFEVNADGGWEAAGFIRHANVLPQRWLVQMILFGPETTVERLTLDEVQTGEWQIPLSNLTDRAIITVSAIAPVTTEWASYEYQIVPSSGESPSQAAAPALGMP